MTAPSPYGHVYWARTQAVKVEIELAKAAGGKPATHPLQRALTALRKALAPPSETRAPARNTVALGRQARLNKDKAGSS